MKTIPQDKVLRTSIPHNRYTLMRNDVELLYQHDRFTSCAALIMCFIDALASPNSESNRGEFEKFTKKHFAELCCSLDSLVPGKSGGYVLYDRYRNGLLHNLGPKDGFALCRNDELDGACSDQVELEGQGRFTGINIVRLFQDFRSLVQHLADEAA